jgi:hypothetical protein
MMQDWAWVIIIVLTSPFWFVLLVVVIALIAHLIETFLNLFRRRR